MFRFNPLTGQFDLVGSSTPSGGGTNYSSTFNNTTDWTLDGAAYKLTVLKATHGKDNPTIQVFELNGSDYIEVNTGVRIDASDNITITVNSTPDLRFVGKIIIS